MFETSGSPSRSAALASGAAAGVVPQVLLDAMSVGMSGTDRDVVDALAAVSAVESVIAAHKARLIAELVRRQQVVRPGGVGVDPVQCPGREQVAAVLKVSCRTAQLEVEYAHQLLSRPQTLAALSAGEMSTRAAKVVVGQTLEVPAEHVGLVEADVVAYACTHTPAEVKRRIARTLHTLLPAVQEAQQAAAAAAREVVMYPADHGMAVLEALLPCHEANLVFGYLNRAADVLKAQDRQHLKDAGLPTNDLASRGTYRADALVALAAAQWCLQTPASHPAVRAATGQQLSGPSRSGQQPNGCEAASRQSNSRGVAGRQLGGQSVGGSPSTGREVVSPRVSAQLASSQVPDGRGLLGRQLVGGERSTGSEAAGHQLTGQVESGQQSDGREEISQREMNGGADADACSDVGAIDPIVVLAGESAVRDVIAAGTIVNIVMDLPTALGIADNPAELRGYGPIPGTLARELATDAAWRRWITDEHGTLTATGTTKYRPPAALRDFIIARDQRCRFPGCHQPAQRCDIDHAIPFDQGGSTTAENLGALCRRHHRIKTAGSWDITDVAPDGTYTWLTPTGEHIRQELQPLLPNTPARPDVAVGMVMADESDVAVGMVMADESDVVVGKTLAGEADGAGETQGAGGTDEGARAGKGKVGTGKLFDRPRTPREPTPAELDSEARLKATGFPF